MMLLKRDQNEQQKQKNSRAATELKQTLQHEALCTPLHPEAATQGSTSAIGFLMCLLYDRKKVFLGVFLKT